jgi:hypothetical protein
MVSDWERVMAIAERELATAHLARALHEIGKGVPADTLEDARRKALALELRMQYLARRVQQTCAVLTDRRIPFMLLKGAAAGALIDPTFCWRPMNDADILVGRKTQAAPAKPSKRRMVVNPGRGPAQTAGGGHHHLPPFLDPRCPGLQVELTSLTSSQPSVRSIPGCCGATRPAAPLSCAGSIGGAPALHAAVHFAWQHAMTFGACRTFRVVSLATKHDRLHVGSVRERGPRHQGIERLLLDAATGDSIVWHRRATR